MASPEVAAPQDGTGPLMRQLVLTYLRDEGVSSANAGHRERAARYLRQALTLDGENADLWALLGTVVEDQVRLACIRQAAALSPGDAQPPGLIENASLNLAQETSFRLATPRLQPTGQPANLPPERSPARRKPWVALASALPRQVRWPSIQLSPRVQMRLLVATVLLLVLALDLILAAAFLRKYEGRIFPGVRIAGLGVGGLSPDEAQPQLQQEVSPFLERRILIRAGGRTWSYSAAEAGLRYRTGDAARDAYALGRGQGLLAPWAERARIGLWGQDIPLVAEVRAGRLEQVLDQLATLERPAIPPGVSWEEGNWIIAAGQDGRHVFLEEAEERLMAALTMIVNRDASFDTAEVVVYVPVVTVTAALPEEQLALLRGQMERAGQPLELRCAEYTWALGAPDIALWLQVELPPPPRTPSVQLNVAAIRAYLAGLAPTVDVPVQVARMELDGERAVAFEPGRDGRRLDLETSLARLEEALRMRLAGQMVNTVELSTTVVPADTAALMAEFGVVEFVGGGRSSFAGSPQNRVTNIVVGGRDLHGRLIAPDEIFSLNEALSPITWEKGYVVSEVIVSGNVGMALGGGLCQVATTLYRAALNSGLEIIERYPHMWRLLWYEQDSPPGFDATIMIGGPDLKIRNNTGHYLLVQVETDGAEAWQTVHFYGTSPGWEVAFSDPVISNGGHDVSFVRTVSRDGVVLSEETFYSHYY